MIRSRPEKLNAARAHGRSRPGVAALLAATALLLGGPASAAACENEGDTPSELTVEQARQAVRCLINEERRGKDRRRLQRNARLEAVAQGHSEAMDAGDFFGHQSPDGSSPGSRVEASGYGEGAKRWDYGENLAWGNGDLGSPRGAVTAMMRSVPHRKVIRMGAWRHLGVGFVVGSPQGSSEDTAIYTVHFGYRR